MQEITSTSAETVRTIGELCVGGDRACASGDLDTLASVVFQLGQYAAEPLHCELASLVDRCKSRQISQATETWCSLRDQIYRSA